jgi:gliding motility-associated-like protein
MKNLEWLFTAILFKVSLISGIQAQPLCGGSLGSDMLGLDGFGMGGSVFLQDAPLYTSDLAYTAYWPSSSNAYTIVQSSFGSPDGLCWGNLADNSGTDQGYMLAATVDAAPLTVLSSTVEVCDQIDYLFSMEVARLGQCPENSQAALSVQVGGVEILNTGVLPSPAAWYTYSALLSIPPGTDFIILEIRTHSAGDFAIDNVKMQHCGPFVSLPDSIPYCEGNTATITADLQADVYSDPYYQWQQSYDGGTSWIDMPGENALSLAVSAFTPGVFYRIQVANGPINFLNESCRLTSNPSFLFPAEPAPVFLTPVICEGDTLTYGEEQYTDPGLYQHTIPGASGCDSILYLQLFNNPAYEQLYSLSLCEGELYQEQEVYEDTTIIQELISVHGCDSIVIMEIDVADAASVPIFGEEVLCSGATTTLSAPPTFATYAWSNGSDEPQIIIDQGGHYSLTVTNTAGCEIVAGIAIAESTPDFSVSATEASCAAASDGQLLISPLAGGDTPYLYQLNEGPWQLQNEFLSLAAGTYTVGVQDALGCEYAEEVVVYAAALPEVVVEGIPATAVDIGDTIYLNIASPGSSYDYHWQADGLISCDTCLAIAWQPFYEGVIQLLASGPEGCEQTQEITIDLRDRYRVYIPTAFSPNGDGNNDTFYPQLGSNASKVISLSIYDRWGGEVYVAKNTAADLSMAWDGSRQGQELDGGTYLYEAEIAFKNGKNRRFAGTIHLIR